MRYVILTVLMLVITCGIAGAAGKHNILVAVFSRADENYAVGFIEKGNTMILAEMIAGQTGAELFEIRTVKPYPRNYDECTDVAKKEQNEKARFAGKIFAGGIEEPGDIAGHKALAEAHDMGRAIS